MNPANLSPLPTASIRLGCLVIVAVTLLLYLPVRDHDFVNFDDDHYVTENPEVLRGLTGESIVWAFTHVHFANWHPLTTLSHLLDVSLFGLNPAGHHLVNVFLHAANAGLLFLLLVRLTNGFWPAAIVAALFAWHPLRVESVAWVAERKDVMSGLFWLLTLQAYVRYIEQPDKKRYWTAVGVFGLAILTKPMVVTLPFVLLLLDYWPLRRLDPNANWTAQRAKFEQLVREKIPFFLLTGVLIVMTVVAQKGGGTVASMENYPLWTRFSNALVSWVRYLGKTFWPTDLVVFYPHPGAWPAAVTLTAAVILGVVTILAVRWARTRPYLFVGWFWYVGTLIPVIGLVQVGLQSMADRYTYLPLIGIAIALVWGAAELIQRKPGFRTPFAITGVVAIVGCLATTRTQLAHWRNSESLFRHAMEAGVVDSIPRVNLANSLIRQNRADEAIEILRAGLKKDPNDAPSWNNLGLALAARAEFASAIDAYNEALRLDPQLDDARNNLASALTELGKPNEALQILELAATTEKPNSDLLNTWGLALAKLGRNDEAIAKYEAAIRLNNYFAPAHQNLGLSLAAIGDFERAIAHYGQALALRPELLQARAALGLALGALKRHSEAVQHYELALHLDPKYAEAHFGMGISLAALGQIEVALTHLAEAVKLQPENPQKRLMLATALQRTGNKVEAVQHYREAGRHATNNPAILAQIAWQLATDSQVEFRDGAAAVQFARRACELTQNRVPAALDALAVALAETGQFAEASQVATTALELARQSGSAAPQGLESRIELFRAGKPFHQ